MGQYPSPYMPPQSPMGPGNPAPFSDPLAPARRASTMLIVFGILGICLGMCSGFVAVSLTQEQYQIFIAQFKLQADMPQFTFSQVKFLYTGLAIGGLFFGFILAALGFFVRRASKAATVFAVILCGLALLYFGMNELALLAHSLSNPALGAFACMFVIPLVLLGLTVKWLMQVLRLIPNLEAARQQWQTHYAMMQQQQQAYMQGAYGYGYPPPQTGYGQPPAGAPPVGMPPAIGYGAMPPVAPPPQNAPPVQQPPDQQNPG